LFKAYSFIGKSRPKEFLDFKGIKYHLMMAFLACKSYFPSRYWHNCMILCLFKIMIKNIFVSLLLVNGDWRSSELNPNLFHFKKIILDEQKFVYVYVFF